MTAPHPDRLFPPDPTERAIARALFAGVAGLPVVSVHGHVDAALLVDDRPFADPSALLVTPDHYVVRVLHSQGVPLEAMGVAPNDGAAVAGPEEVWATLCAHWGALRGTPTRLWLEHTLAELFGVEEDLRPANAAATYEQVAAALPGLTPRTLYARFGLEVLATTDGALDDLAAHRALADDPSFGGSVVPTFRPDAVVDPARPGWADAVEALGALTGADTTTLPGLLQALALRRQAFKALGARSTDHALSSAQTVALGDVEAAVLFSRLRSGRGDAADAARLAGHLLVEMAALSVDDGLVLQLHPGVLRNHDGAVAARFGPDVGADFPVATEFTRALRPLLERFGSSPGLRIVVFTVDETAWSRELAPMAGYYPALRLGAPWWFLDAPDAMGRFFAAVVESAGYANLSGFVDDTRAFCSIGARHDMARRVVCAHLAQMVARHRLTEADGHELARAFALDLPRATYGLAPPGSDQANSPGQST